MITVWSASERRLLVTSPPDRLSGHVRKSPFSSHRFYGGLNILHLAQGPCKGPSFFSSASIKDEGNAMDGATCRHGSAVAR